MQICRSLLTLYIYIYNCFCGFRTSQGNGIIFRKGVFLIDLHLRELREAIMTVESLMKRGSLFLEDGDWKNANEYFNRVLDVDPEYAPAYIGMLCAELRVKSEDLLIRYSKPLSGHRTFQKALRFAKPEYKNSLEILERANQKRIAAAAQQVEEWCAKDLCRYCGSERNSTNWSCKSCGRGSFMKCHHCGGKVNYGLLEDQKCTSCGKTSVYKECYYCGGKIISKFLGVGKRRFLCKSCNKDVYYR